MAVVSSIRGCAVSRSLLRGCLKSIKHLSATMPSCPALEVRAHRGKSTEGTLESFERLQSISTDFSPLARTSVQGG